MRDEIRRMVLVTSGIVELTRNRAEVIVRDLIKSGDLPGSQAGHVLMDLMERSRQNRNEVLNLVRSEIRGQVEAIGLASKRDVDRLERRIARLETPPTARKTAKKTAKRTAKKPTKKTTRKSAKKPTGKSSRKTTAKTTRKTTRKTTAKTSQRRSTGG